MKLVLEDDYVYYWIIEIYYILASASRDLLVLLLSISDDVKT